MNKIMAFVVWRRIICAAMVFIFTVGSVRVSYATGVLDLPKPGVMLDVSPSFSPVSFKGIKIYADDPFRFDFILDKGDAAATNEQFKADSNRLVKYFLAALTIPAKDLWVNLSPYEKDRIVPEAFGRTEMGRDMLAQDYILKQITASLSYPEGKAGQAFWKRIYAQAQEKFGTTEIPVDTFNKVWIVPEKAKVFENDPTHVGAGSHARPHQATAFVVESRLKVMLESDYLAMDRNGVGAASGRPPEDQGGRPEVAPTHTNELSKNIIREIILPILEKEVNEGENFASLRQIYHALILATWYKRKAKESILGQVYVSRQKTAGIDIADKSEKDKIWQQYVQAFEQGVYSLIKDEYDPRAGQVVARKYFSGGVLLDPAQKLEVTADAANIAARDFGKEYARIPVQIDMAMADPEPVGPLSRDDLLRVNISALQGTNIFLSNLLKFVWYSTIPQVPFRIKGIKSLDLLIKKRIIDERLINELGIVRRLQKSLEFDDENVRTAAAYTLRDVEQRGIDIGGNAVQARVRSIMDKHVVLERDPGSVLEQDQLEAMVIDPNRMRDEIAILANVRADMNSRLAAVRFLGGALFDGMDIGSSGLSALVEAFIDNGPGEFQVSQFSDDQTVDGLVHALKARGVGMGVVERNQFMKIGHQGILVLGQLIEKGIVLAETPDAEELRVRPGLTEEDVLLVAGELHEQVWAILQSAYFPQEGVLAYINSHVLSSIYLYKKFPDFKFTPEDLKIIGQIHSLNAIALKGFNLGLIERGNSRECPSVSSDKVREAATDVFALALDAGKLGVLPMEDIESYYTMFQQEKNNVDGLKDDDFNVRSALIAMAHSLVAGEIEGGDVRYFWREVNSATDPETVQTLLDVIRKWSLNGSSEAQHFLETRVNAIFSSKRLRKGELTVEVTSKEEMFLNATLKSFRQRSVLPFLTDSKFPLELRIKIMRLLAASGYIDSTYAAVRAAEASGYLDVLSRFFVEHKLMAPKILADRLVHHRTTLDEINKKKPALDTLVASHDYRALVHALVADDELAILYYLFYQSPFQYSGTDPISFERFRKLLNAAVNKLKYEYEDEFKKMITDAYINTGLDSKRAVEIAEALFKGQPPLPKDSPFLVDGKFVPQRIDVLSALEESSGDIRDVRRRFESVLSDIVVVLKIDRLLFTIPNGIVKRFSSDTEKQIELRRELNVIVDRIQEGVVPQEVLQALIELNDKVYPPSGRARTLDSLMAADINPRMRNIPLMAQYMVDPQKKLAAAEGSLDVENVDINTLVRSSQIVVNLLRTRQAQGKLKPEEKNIVAGHEPDMKDVLRIFLYDLFESSFNDHTGPLQRIVPVLEKEFVSAYDDYIALITPRVDLEHLPPVVYLDFIYKSNLMEFLRFADGAHCCIASDPKVSALYEGGTLYERHMPRFLTNATSFWWQVSTAPDSGKQIGWYENWLGLEKRKVMVGTELLYLSHGYQSLGVQKAVLAKVEKILFSTHVSRIAQAQWDIFEHGAPINAMSPPANYVPQDLSIVKLQSLEDGQDMYEDAPFPRNVETMRQATEKEGVHEGFFVANNPDTFKAVNVSLQIIKSQDVTEALVDQLKAIEDIVFPEDKRAGRKYMRSHLMNPGAVIFILRDDATQEIVGYRHAVPAKDAWLMPKTPEYLPFRTGEVLYQSDTALLPEYWGKAKMGEKFLAFFKEAKQRGFKYLATHTEHADGIRPGTSLSEKYQKLGYEIKWQESNWHGTGQVYDFLMLDLDKVDPAMVTLDPVTNNTGGIDLSVDEDFLEVQDSGHDDFHYEPADLARWDDAFGVVPVILGIQTTDLRAFLR